MAILQRGKLEKLNALKSFKKLSLLALEANAMSQGYVACMTAVMNDYIANRVIFLGST